MAVVFSVSELPGIVDSTNSFSSQLVVRLFSLLIRSSSSSHLFVSSLMIQSIVRSSGSV